MNSIKTERILHVVFLLFLTIALAGCSDDDPAAPETKRKGGAGEEGENLVGTWVLYQEEIDGRTRKEGGFFAEFRSDGTGTTYDLGDPLKSDEFTWTATDDTVMIEDPYQDTVLEVYVTANSLMTTETYESGPYIGYYQRHVGESALIGTWRFVSIYNSYTEEIDREGPATWTFREDGTWTQVSSGGSTSPAENFYVNLAILELGEDPQDWERFVFTVVGRTLYLSIYVTEWIDEYIEIPVLYVIEFTKG